MAFSFGKRSILGLVAGALMTLGVASPAFASVPATSGSGTVNVTATNQPSLTFTIAGSPVTVAFNPLDPAVPCLAANNGVQFSVKSNRSYTGTVAAASTGSSNIPVTQLFWSHSPAANCTTNGTAFSTAAASWTSGSSTAGTTINDTYAIQTLYTDTDGTVAMTLTYAVTQ